mgnify:CR=1 FL=1
MKVIDRQSGKECIEKIYGAASLRFLYDGGSFASFLLHYLVRYPFFSKFYGLLQKSRWSRYKIVPFIKAHEVDVSEFVLPVSSFCSFNDFFTRQLKLQARPIAASDFIIPADGRYLFFPNIDLCEGIWVKGKKMNLEKLVGDKNLAESYKEGTLVIGRLCPSDYHRYHFPVDGQISASRLLNRWLYSVNPIALKKNIEIFTENRRIVNEVETLYGKILIIEVGATCVGSIHHQFEVGDEVKKGAEMGYFSFGGSCLILLFPKGMIKIDEDLLTLGASGIEVRCLMGQPLAKIEN